MELTQGTETCLGATKTKTYTWVAIRLQNGLETNRTWVEMENIDRLCSGSSLDAKLLCRWYDQVQDKCMMPMEKRCALSVMTKKDPEI